MCRHPPLSAANSDNMANSGDTWYVALLGLADTFLKANNVKECVRCLSAVFQFNPPQLICARTHLQLGNILHTKTNNQVKQDKSCIKSMK